MSGKKRTFLAIDVSYPKICTYPEYEGKPYYGIKYLEDGETILGFGTYKPEVLSEYLRNYFMPSAEPERHRGEWIEEPKWWCNLCAAYDKQSCYCNLHGIWTASDFGCKAFEPYCEDEEE